MHADVQTDHVHSKSLPDLIAKLLLARQQLLVLFQRLGELRPYTTQARPQLLLQQFCQLLVDYIALGHFEVYQCFEEHASDSAHCRRVKRLGRELYPAILLTTTAALDFNDSYTGEGRALTELDAALSGLGEQLATRIELEDRLITALQWQGTV